MKILCTRLVFTSEDMAKTNIFFIESRKVWAYCLFFITCQSQPIIPVCAVSICVYWWITNMASSIWSVCGCFLGLHSHPLHYCVSILLIPRLFSSTAVWHCISASLSLYRQIYHRWGLTDTSSMHTQTRWEMELADTQHRQWWRQAVFLFESSAKP